MRQLVSKQTFLFKRIFPLYWFIFVGTVCSAALIHLFRNPTQTTAWEILPFILGSLLMLVVGYLMMRFFIFDLADSVLDRHDTLIFRRKREETIIPLSDIINVSCTTFSNPSRITLMVRDREGALRKFAFCPPTHWKPWKDHPLFLELVQRIDAARHAHPKPSDTDTP